MAKQRKNRFRPYGPLIEGQIEKDLIPEVMRSRRSPKPPIGARRGPRGYFETLRLEERRRERVFNAIRPDTRIIQSEGRGEPTSRFVSGNVSNAFLGMEVREYGTTFSAQRMKDKRGKRALVARQVGVLTQGDITLQPRKRVGVKDIDLLDKMGFKTDTGLSGLLKELSAKNIQFDLVGGELRAFGGSLREEVNIPLFANNLAAGDIDRVEALKRKGLLNSSDLGEFMFRGGSVSSVTAQVAELSGSTGNTEKLLFKSPRSFSEFLYSEILNNVKNSQPGYLKDSINQVLGATDALIPGAGSALGKDVNQSLGYVDPLQYAGRQKLGRHHLGHSQQMILDTTDAKLVNLLKQEQEVGLKLKTANAMGGGISSRKGITGLRLSHEFHKEQVIEHLKKMEAEDNIHSGTVKKLNLALASQSGEWLFQENQSTVNKDRPSGRLILKMTSADIKSLSLLPGQDIFEKGRQFQLSRGVMAVRNIDQIPAAVAEIMGHNSGVMRGIKRDVAALGGVEDDLSLASRTFGAQFLDPRLNEALFGDSGAMMSANLMERLDYDPVSGHSRHTVTSKIRLKQVESARSITQLRGIIRTDLFNTILAHLDTQSPDATDTIRFKPGAAVALQAHSEQLRGKAIALDMAKDGKVMVGEKSMQPDHVRAKDLDHANDIVRDLQTRGMDPSKVDITGVRFHKKSGELELIMAQRQSEVITADSGYIFGGQRISVGQVLNSEKSKKIARLLGHTREERAQIRDLVKNTGFVFGDLGLTKNIHSPKADKTAYGFHTTLLSNLAEIISERADGNVSHKAVKDLTSAMGGSAEIARFGKDTKVQFAGLGNKFERIEDQQFRSNFGKLLNTLGPDIKKEFQQRSFANIKVKPLLGMAPGFNEKLLEKVATEQNRETAKFMEQLGMGSVAAGLRGSTTSGSLDKLTALVVKSIGGEIAVRDEEPMAKFGTKATNITPRILNILSESLEFIGADRHRIQINKETTKDIVAARSQLFKDLINSHPYLFKSGGDYSLMLQMGEDPVFKEGQTLKEIRKAFSDKSLGEMAVLTANSKQLQEIQTINRGTSIEAARDLAQSYGGGLDTDELGKTILGMVDQSTGVAKVSDQMIMIQGTNGPMVIPSPKAMGFSKEKGFLRVPGSKKQFNELETRVFEKLRGGETAQKEAQSMLLDIYQDVERLEEARLEKGGDVEGQLVTLQDKLTRLYKVAAANTLSKQGLLYSSALSGNKVAMGGRLRLQTHSAVGMFEVGLTESALKKMLAGSKLKKKGKTFRGTKVSPLDKHGNLTKEFRKMVEQGDFFLHGYREPIASGRQMMALKVRLLGDKDVGAVGSTSKFDFSASAFLHSSMVRFGLEGDFDKDSINLFRMMSMNNADIASIHRGQKDQLEGILGSIMGENRTGLLSEAIGDTKFKTIDDVQDMLNHMSNRGFTFNDDGTVRGARESVKNFSLDSLVKIVEPKHLTPIIEAHFAGRSYVDLMMGHLVDIQSTVEGSEIIRQNFFARVGEESGRHLSELLDSANSLFANTNAGSRSGRLATYNYSDARNLTKYMFLKKAADASSQGKLVADEFVSQMLSVGKEFKSMGIAEQKDFVDTLADKAGARHVRARQLIDLVSQDLLSVANLSQDELRKNSGIINPQTASILHGLGQASQEQRESHIDALAKRMIFVEAKGDMLKDSARGGVGDGMTKNMPTIMRRLGIQNFVDMSQLETESLSAQTISDIQGMASDPGAVDQINQAAMERRSDAAKESIARAQEHLKIDAVGGTPSVPNSSYKNAIISGEFMAGVTQMKYFKPAAAIIGGLAGVEAIRSAIDRFTPGNVPTMGYNTANTMPPPPMISSPQDPTFARDAMPNTNIARVAKHHGQRNSVNISGRANSPIDFRGVVNSASLNNSYIPNIQGSFRSSINDTMSQVEMSQFVNDRMDSSF